MPAAAEKATERKGNELVASIDELPLINALDFCVKLNGIEGKIDERRMESHSYVGNNRSGIPRRAPMAGAK